MDLAAGHVAAPRLLDSPKCFAGNLGTGAGSSSVLEVVKAFGKASGRSIPYELNHWPSTIALAKINSAISGRYHGP